MRVLTIDDSVTARKTIRNILEPEGHHVVEASSAEKALAMLRNGREFDVILLDLRMPDMDGYAFLDCIHEEDLAVDAKIIAVTQVSRIANILQALEKGADDYVIKPFTARTILEKLETAASLPAWDCVQDDDPE